MAVQDFTAKSNDRWFRCNSGRVAADLLVVNYPTFRECKDATSITYNRETQLRLRINTNSRLTTDIEVSRNLVSLDYVSNPDEVINIVPKVLSAASTNNCPVIFIPSIENTQPKDQHVNKHLDATYSDMFELQLDRSKLETDHPKNFRYYLFCPPKYPSINELMSMTLPSKD